MTRKNAGCMICTQGYKHEIGVDGYLTINGRAMIIASPIDAVIRDRIALDKLGIKVSIDIQHPVHSVSARYCYNCGAELQNLERKMIEWDVLTYRAAIETHEDTVSEARLQP